ncbi:MAG TPA: protein kinase, partial [Myxococcales bacterium]
TITGSILGSPAHLAPETIEGKPADPRADLFSFGTILYWLSCGQLPYQAPSPAALLRNILEGKRPDPRILRSSVSDAQARIIARCLENDPARRYQSAGEVKTELAELLREAGLEDPVAELAAFVKEPEQQAVKVREQLVARSLSLGEGHLAQGKTSIALAAFGRALALDPLNAQAKGRVERIRRRERLLKYGRRALLGAAAAALAWLGAWEVRAAVERARAAQAKELAEHPVVTKPPAPPVVEPPKAPPAATVKRKQPSPKPVARVELPVKLHARYPSDVTVDGRELGNSNIFPISLAPGPHKVVVRNRCCADFSQEVVISAQHDPMYQLEYGPPKPASFSVKNAPPDARIFINGVLAGTASDLPSWAMSKPDQPATIRIGDRTLTMTLKAGQNNELDYSKASP